MSRLWSLIKRKITRRKAPTNGHADALNSKSSPDEETGEQSSKPPVTNGYKLDPYWEPLTREEILADLAVEYEDTEENEIEPEPQTETDEQDSSEPRPVPEPQSAVEATPEKITSSSESLLVTEPQIVAETATYSENVSSRIWLPHRSSYPIDDSERDVINLEAGSDSVKRSYMSIVPTTIQMLNEKTTLFVWLANFHPAIGRRFSSVIISVKFTPAPDHPQDKTISRTRQVLRSASPTVIAHAPHKSFGATSSEQRSITWGLELPISAPAGPVSVGITPSGQTATKKEVQHAFTITGSARGSPARHTCVWTVEENSSTERGIPSELQVAALVQYTGGPLMMEVDITGRTAGGFLPSHDLRPKTTAMGRKKVVDPSKFKDLLYEFDLGNGDPLAASRQLLDRWTGRVDGAVLEFDQPLARA